MSILFWIALVFIVYTLAGYPLLIALLARFLPQSVFEPYLEEQLPQVTLLIAAYNEERVLERKLQNTFELDFPAERLQILIAADGSSDRTAAIATAHQADGVELNHIPERGGKMAAINRAMPRARGEIVVFSDANNLYEPQALRELIKPFTDPGVGASTGEKLILLAGDELSASEGLYWKYESWIKKSESRLGSCTSSTGEILAIRRKAFEAPPGNIVNDDHFIVIDLVRRGYRVVYSPSARSYEEVSLSAGDEIKRRARMNAGLFQTISLSGYLLPKRNLLYVWKLISHKYLRGFIPVAMILALLVNTLQVVRSPWSADFSLGALTGPAAWCLLALQILFYVLALLGNHYRPGGIAGKLFYLPTFLVNSNWSVLVGLRDFLTGKQAHLWHRVARIDATKN